MRTLADVAALISGALGRRFPARLITVEAGVNTGGRDAVYVTWYDLPHSEDVRAVVLEATDVLTSVERGFKVNYRHRFSLEIRRLAREAIRREVPDYDYLSEDGQVNQDSTYYYTVPDLQAVTVNGFRLTVPPQRTPHELVKRVCWLICDWEDV